MSLNWDPTTVSNLVFCIIVLVMGVWGYQKKKDKTPLFIGVAFLFFAISHIATILGSAADLSYPLLITRVIGYLVVIYALYKYIKP